MMLTGTLNGWASGTLRVSASGGMLGYVFDGDIEKARTSVTASIEANREKLKTTPPFKLVPSSVLPGDSRVSETIHALAHGGFVIYHLFVAVLDD